MKISLIIPIAVLAYHYFHYFHLYNYEIILVGKILYINSMIKNQRLLDQLIHSFIICFSCDILFRSLILEFQDRDLPKLINSIAAQIIITTIQWNQQIKFEIDIFYNLSQAKLLTWAFKNRYLQVVEVQQNFQKLFILLILGSVYQNCLLGSKKNVATTIISLLANYFFQPFFFAYQTTSIALTAYRSKHYLSQYIFYILKLF